MNLSDYSAPYSIENKKEQIYQHAKRKMRIEERKSLNEAVSLLSTITDYKDATNLISECRVRLTALAVQKDKYKSAKKVLFGGKTKAIALVLAVALLGVGIAGTALTLTSSKTNATVADTLGLSTLIIPGTISVIDDYSYSYNTSLRLVEVSNGVTKIGTGAFFKCTNLEYVKIGDTVTTIGPTSFSCCDKLTQITIGKGVTRIGNYAFLETPLVATYYEGTATEWEDIRFGLENDILDDTVYFYSEQKPADGGRYWRYVNNTPTAW